MAQLATTDADLSDALTLRHAVFRGRRGPGQGDDADRHDALARHLLIRQGDSGHLVGCCRLLSLPSGAAVQGSYSAQHYDLTGLATYPAPLLELGRFCIDPAATHPDILRLMWAALTRIVDAEAVQMLFGCTSFPGTDPQRHAAALGLLATHRAAPPALRPGPKARATVALSDFPPTDTATALRALPPLLRTYLEMGGWTSDHAVIDPDLNTLHIFTALEIAAIPAPRARLLRHMAQH